MILPNFNISNNLIRAKQFGTSSRNYITDTARSCALSAYKYGCDTLKEAKDKIVTSMEPHTTHLKKSAKVTGFLIITAVALRVLSSISNPLLMDISFAAVVAECAFRKPDKAAQFVVLYAIGSVLGKNSTLSTYSLPVLEGFVFYFVASTAVDFLWEKVGKKD